MASNDNIKDFKVISPGRQRDNRTETIRKETQAESGKDNTSKQLDVDPFKAKYNEKGLIEPPLKFEALLQLKEEVSMHGACIYTKVDDIAGAGFFIDALEGVENPDEGKKQEIENFLNNCNPESTFGEVLSAVWEDFETLGWGIMEVVTDGTGKPQEVYHIPGYMVRAHKDGIRFAQYIQGKYRWFKRYGAEGIFDLKNGDPVEDETYPEEKRAGEVIVFRTPNSRSNYYGIPRYISSIAAIAAQKAVNDFNIDFFDNNAIPDQVLKIMGAGTVPDAIEKELRAFFNKESSGRQGEKLAILPVPNNIEVQFEQLTQEVKEASFKKFREDNNIEICIAHRVPPYRVSWAVMGSLGGNVAEEMNEVYKNSTVSTGQDILEHRINNQLIAGFDDNDEKRIENLDYRFKMKEMDLSDKLQELDYASKAKENNLMTTNEARGHIGKDPYDEEEFAEAGYGDMPPDLEGGPAPTETTEGQEMMDILASVDKQAYKEVLKKWNKRNSYAIKKNDPDTELDRHHRKQEKYETRIQGVADNFFHR